MSFFNFAFSIVLKKATFTAARIERVVENLAGDADDDQAEFNVRLLEHQLVVRGVQASVSVVTAL
jgi:hypothetical protein